MISSSVYAHAHTHTIVYKLTNTNNANALTHIGTYFSHIYLTTTSLHFLTLSLSLSFYLLKRNGLWDVEKGARKRRERFSPEQQEASPPPEAEACNRARERASDLLHHKFLAAKVRAKNKKNKRTREWMLWACCVCYFYICPFFILQAHKRYRVPTELPPAKVHTLTPSSFVRPHRCFLPPSFTSYRLRIKTPFCSARLACHLHTSTTWERMREWEWELFHSHSHRQLQHQQHIQQCCRFTTTRAVVFKEWRCKRMRKKNTQINKSLDKIVDANKRLLIIVVLLQSVVVVVCLTVVRGPAWQWQRSWFESRDKFLEIRALPNCNGSGCLLYDLGLIFGPDLGQSWREATLWWSSCWLQQIDQTGVQSHWKGHSQTRT